jgi:hypothetical protein
MTPDEIREVDESQKTEKGWLREMCLQLALLHKALTAQQKTAFDRKGK